MRERIISSFYTRDLYIKLQRLYQGSRSIEKYFKEMEVTLIRAQGKERREERPKGTKFIRGLHLPKVERRGTMALWENGELESERSQKDLSNNESEYKARLGLDNLFSLPLVIGLLSACLSFASWFFWISSLVLTRFSSLRLVEKLAIPTFPHSEPYKLQWLSEKGMLVVDKQVSLTMTLGKYKD
ncbi:hypothetical protein CR513_50201, partial [Mucuna pruriens]